MHWCCRALGRVKKRRVMIADDIIYGVSRKVCPTFGLALKFIKLHTTPEFR